ncbi:MAG: hypothetical protein HC852_14125 [Acaryochloridaceae cyanobacterium RU_4_10]|nr:hypothetical protein [Acaryochloridaceae cyanobacterium RU_4_10]
MAFPIQANEDIFQSLDNQSNEISDMTLEPNRPIKLPPYAQARILELWIVNLQEEIEVYRQPMSETCTIKQVFTAVQILTLSTTRWLMSSSVTISSESTSVSKSC